MFVFQNGFWLNLHQFISGEAYRPSVKAAAGLDQANLNASDRATWTSAIDRYNDIFKRNMVLDEGLIRKPNALAMTEDAARLPESLDTALGANIAAELKAAAPICCTPVARAPARQGCVDRIREVSHAGPRNRHEGGSRNRAASHKPEEETLTSEGKNR
jgi:hypothetical protein